MNKKITVFVFSLIFGLAIFLSARKPVTAQAEDPLSFPVDQIIIKYKRDANLDQAAQAQVGSQMQRLNDVAGVAIEYYRPMSGNGHVLRLVEPLSVDEAVSMTAQLAALPEVEYAEPDYKVFPIESVTNIIPNDTRYNEQWHYFAPTMGAYGVNAPGAWDITKGNANIYIAVLDTGITDHADLAGRWIGGYDLVSDATVANDGNGRDSDPHDPGDWISSSDQNLPIFYGCPITNSRWHGTHVAGTIGAFTNNNQGVAGLNWVSKIVPVRVLGKCFGYISDIADGIRWAAGLHVPGTTANAYPAKVINMSLGGENLTGCSATYQSAIDAAYGAGSMIVVSAGNSNKNASVFQPANCNHVVTVAATNRDGNRAFYSNYGSIVDISAPGGETSIYGNGVLSTLNTGTQGPVSDTYGYYQGTSMAAPHVSGVASLIYSLDPSLTPNQVLNIMQNTVTPFPAGSSCSTSICGSGIVNAAAALGAPPFLSEIANPGGEANYTVNWSDIPIAIGYSLQEDDNPSFSSPSTIYNGTDNYKDVAGKAGGTWYYRVRANYSNSDFSPWSNTVSTTVKPDPPLLDAITNPGNTDAYTVTWSTSVGADGYLLQEAITDTFTNATTRFMGAATQYQVTGQAGGEWYYRVRAHNAGGNSDWSNSETVTVALSALSAPNQPNLSLEQDNDIIVDWEGVNGASSYILEESDNQYFIDPVVVYADTNTETRLDDYPGGTWYFRVRAANDTDQGPWSNSASIFVIYRLFAPISLIANIPEPVPQGPKPGFWVGEYEEFYVSPDGSSVDRFATNVSVSGCGNYKITHRSPKPAIVSGKFTFNGSFYFSGTFNSSMTASGMDGLNNFEIAGCGWVNGGPWNWEVNWNNDSQPTFQSGELIVPQLVKPMPDYTNAHEVIKLSP